MNKVKSVLLATSMLAVGASLTPAQAIGIINFAVTEQVVGNNVTYDFHNNSTIGGISAIEFDVTNPDPFSAPSDDRTNWDSQASTGSSCGIASITGFCFTDNGGTSPLNPIGDGQSQIFDATTGTPASTFYVEYVTNGGDTGRFTGQTTTAAVPEPATLAVLGAGLVGAGYARRKRRTTRR
jgi:hypothetical protein